MNYPLLEYLKDKIKERKEGFLSFHEYMNDCLYHPQWGYYMQERIKIGKQGDFYTSSSVHPVFAEAIASTVVEIFGQWGQSIQFCEMGAGTGSFAKQFLDYIQASFPQQYGSMSYLILEKSSYHREEQQRSLQEHLSIVTWLDELVPQSFQGICFSNELVDAFSVHVVEKREGKLCEVGVSWSVEKQALEEAVVPVVNPEVISYLEEHQLELREGQRMEVPLEAMEWVRAVNEYIVEGLWITIDYGYTHEELHAPYQQKGSLRCYYRHHMDDRPLERPGEKDMTSHVHFDSLSRTAISLGWTPMGLYSQVDFLLRVGILKQLQETDWGTAHLRDPFNDEGLKRNRAIRQLISPEGISGSFRVLVLGKGKAVGHSYDFQQTYSI